MKSNPQDESMIQYQKALYLSFVSLRKIGPNQLPDGIGSGCIISYRGKRILVTVSHVTQKPGNWAMEVRHENGNTLLYGLGPMNLLDKYSFEDNQLKLLDFSYVELPDSINPLRQEFNINQELTAEQQITIHQLPIDGMPKHGIKYGFSGNVLPSIEKHPQVTYFTTEVPIYTGLELIRTSEDFHYFKLATEHPGHIYFEGCSGSPLISEDGTTIVGLICGGVNDTDEIRVFPLSKYKIVFDILVNS